jgi:hypothetical protein
VKELITKVRKEAWDTPPKNATEDALRNALAKEAISICDNTGSSLPNFITYCAETIKEFCRNQHQR